MTNKPLNGIKVVDFTRMFAGPFCTMLLADLGADVVKIELPDGDPIRHQGPPFYDRESMSFLAVNRNKRSIVLNAKQPEDLEIIHRLVDQADVIVENFLPGVMDRMGLSYAEVSQKKPQLIYASMSGMGANGPLRDKKAFDLTVQAEAGFMSLTGEPGGQPIKLGTSVFDLVCGQYATSAIVTALYQRTQSGRGCLIETSLFEGLVSFLVDAGMEWLLMNNLRAKWGSEHASTVPYKAFKAKDGWIVIGAAVQRLYEAFVKVIGREDLATDPRFATLKGRVSNRVTLYEILDAEVAKWPDGETGRNARCCGRAMRARQYDERSVRASANSSPADARQGAKAGWQPNADDRLGNEVQHIRYYRRLEGAACIGPAYRRGAEDWLGINAREEKGT